MPNLLKYLLQKVRDFKYTNDEDYLKDISNIQITYDNNPDLDKLPMCYKYVNFINPKKKIIIQRKLLLKKKGEIYKYII